MLITGHAGEGHTDALGASVEKFRAENPGIEVILQASFEPIKDRFPMNHAARGETSLQILTDRETVDLAMVPAGNPPTLDDDGVWGEDPRMATAEHGAEIMQSFVDALSKQIQQVIDRVTE